jgi:hypothetical protein
MYRAPVVGSLWKSSRSAENDGRSCCRCAASAFFSAATGAVVACKNLSDDADNAAPMTPVAKAVEAAKAPAPPHHPCRFMQRLGIDQSNAASVACPLADPARWALQQRAIGTRAVAHTRRWLASAADSSISPGVLTATGTASALPALAATLPFGGLWFAAVSLFTIGAVDAYITRAVETRLRAHGVTATSAASAPATAPSTSSSSPSLAADAASLLSLPQAVVSSYRRPAPVAAVGTPVPAAPAPYLASPLLAVNTHHQSTPFFATYVPVAFEDIAPHVLLGATAAVTSIVARRHFASAASTASHASAAATAAKSASHHTPAVAAVPLLYHPLNLDRYAFVAPTNTAATSA